MTMLYVNRTNDYVVLLWLKEVAHNALADDQDCLDAFKRKVLALPEGFEEGDAIGIIPPDPDEYRNFSKLLRKLKNEKTTEALS